MAISLLLFDVNGVLYQYDTAARRAFLSRLTGLTEDAIAQAIWGSGFEDQGDAGELDADSYLHGFGARLGHPISRADWTEAVRVALAPIAPMLNLARTLGRHLRLGVLTNNNLLVRDQLDTLYPALRPIFGDAICVSAEFGRRKPDPAVYHACLGRLGATPAETLFIDDSPANIAGAQQAGLHAHHHTTVARLQRMIDLGAPEEERSGLCPVPRQGQGSLDPYG